MTFDKHDLGRVFEIDLKKTDFIDSRFTITHIEHSPDEVHVNVQFRPPALANYSYIDHEAAAEIMTEEILRSMDIVAECRRPGLTVEGMRTLVRAFYARAGNSCGGHLHIVLDDGNIDDDDIDFCIARAVEAKDAEAEAPWGACCGP